MFLKIIIAAFCFMPLYSFSMDCSGSSIQDVDHEWFLEKLVEYKRARGQRQKRDELVAHLQGKDRGYDGAVVRRVGVTQSCCNQRAKL